MVQIEQEEGETCQLKDERQKIRFDDALRLHLGQFGPFSRRMVALICLEEAFFTFQVMVAGFLAATPEFWCNPPGAEGLGNCTRPQFSNITVPWMESEGSLKHDQCHMYDRNYTSSISGGCSRAEWAADNATITACLSWEYDRSELGDTIVTEWDGVCSGAWMASTVASVFLAGRAFGNVLFGWLADRYGRKKIIIGAGIANLAAGAACAASPSFLFFIVMRFFHSILATGKSNTGFVCALEFSGPSWRVFAANMYQLSWAVAYVLLAGIAFLLRFHSWRILLMVLLIPETIYYLLVYFFMPESPRWLYLKDRNKEADEVVRKIAKDNNTTLPTNVHVTEKKDVSNRTPLDLIRTPKLRMLTFSLAYVWASVTFVYYGLAMNTGSLAGNKYINFCISGAVEIPAYILLILVFYRYGRIWPFSMSLCLGGIALLVIAAVPEDVDWVVVTLAMIGKFFITCSSAILWIYSTEVYPTCIRNIGLTVSGITARFSSPIAPYIALVGDTYKFLPYIIFGALSLSSGVLVLLLPETKDTPMAQTIQDGEDLIRENRVQLKFWKKNSKKHSSTTSALNGTI